MIHHMLFVLILLILILKKIYILKEIIIILMVINIIIMVNLQSHVKKPEPDSQINVYDYCLLPK